ncbi:hypothetical protein PM3016_5422 [Paenibacillus mucilaginosus 3016]|uniref:Uncharacterized protein n=1 Tax=Paenibacillus mucilaginosus 3016 TaxID=1116391 RepID=H6NDS3_9BACL|nr:hypothetical protein [Paenibacillus mucilaginosus]AFC32122.1 hypothetical protein PM3016_5422 [Paenibacillus mucilaginosus 3016]WFA20626.1 hypothetical protein ERY13_26995 [Paenibacillus mucilaginosus]
MTPDQLVQVEQTARLAERYGVALILAIVLLVVVLYVLRLFMTGKIVPRELLDKAEEDRDELTKTINEIRGPLEEIRDVVKNLKRDKPRGG